MRWNSKEPKLQQSLQPGFLGHREVVETGKGTWEVKFSSGKTGRVTTLVSQNAPSWGHRGLCKNQRWKTCWDSWFRWASCWVGDKNAEVMGIWNISMKTMKSAIKVAEGGRGINLCGCKKKEYYLHITYIPQDPQPLTSCQCLILSVPRDVLCHAKQALHSDEPFVFSILQ